MNMEMGKYIPKITGEKIYLSPMFIDDFVQYTRWLNDFEVIRYLGQAAKCYSTESQRKVMEKYVSEGWGDKNGLCSDLALRQ